MPGREPSTTARGLGYRHQAERRRLLAALVDGVPCPLCGQPMDRAQDLDADHELPRVLGGVSGPLRLAHSRCNRSAGAALGNRLRGQRGRDQAHQERAPAPPGWRRADGGPVSRQWHPDIVWSDGEPPPDAPGRLGSIVPEGRA